MKKGITAAAILLAVLVSAGFFPIINLNPENPVRRELLMQVLTICMAASLYGEVGILETKICPKQQLWLIALLNAVLVLMGLAVRYLLELGEISNVYNFTGMNVLFQVLFLSWISTGTYLIHGRKRKESD